MEERACAYVWVAISGENAMASIVTEQGIIHYEVDGRGEPILFLHGWLESWGCWRPTMEALAKLNRYRIYALDFWGFGESSKKRITYNISDFVRMVDHFMYRMGIESAPVVGHSMGGTVAMCLALDEPHRVRKVIVVGSPMVGESLSLPLRLSGYEIVASFLWSFPFVLRFMLWCYSPWVAENRQAVYEMTAHTVSQATMESFLWSIYSLLRTDLRPRLGQIKIPSLGVYGSKDGVVNPNQAEVIAQMIPHARVEVMEGCRHLPMLAKPEKFNRILLDFLAS